MKYSPSGKKRNNSSLFNIEEGCSNSSTRNSPELAINKSPSSKLLLMQSNGTSSRNCSRNNLFQSTSVGHSTQKSMAAAKQSHKKNQLSSLLFSKHTDSSSRKVL